MSSTPHCFQNLTVNSYTFFFFESSAKASFKGSFPQLPAKSTHFPADMTLLGPYNSKTARNGQICGHKVTGNLLSPVAPLFPHCQLAPEGQWFGPHRIIQHKDLEEMQKSFMEMYHMAPVKDEKNIHRWRGAEITDRQQQEQRKRSEYAGNRWGRDNLL